MKRHRAGLHFPLLGKTTVIRQINKVGEKISTYFNVDLVTAENDGDVLAYSLEVTVPVGHIFVCDPGGDVEHDNPALALDIISIAETPELLLASGVPDVEADGAVVGRESERVDLDTKSGWRRRAREIVDDDE